MRPNRVKQLLRHGEPALGTWLVLGSPLGAEWLAHQGFDWLSVDQGHSAIDATLTQSLLQAISVTDVLPLVTVPWKDPQAIERALDVGAYGLFVPTIETREEAEMVVSATKYPPVGTRALGGARRHLYGGADYVQHANDELLVVAVIQTVRGIRNVDDILSVPGIDACFVGPHDLCASLGLRPTFEPADERFEEAIKHVFDACIRHDVAPGIHTRSIGHTRHRLDQGWQLIGFSSDGSLMAQAARCAFEAVRDLGADADTRGSRHDGHGRQHTCIATG
jgi:4-hydroxy-2-oxoheptanedioate aldolase